MYHFSSHVQFQYLLQKCGMSQEALQKEMNEYYSQPAWELMLTKYSKVKAVKLKPLHPKPLIKPLIEQRPRAKKAVVKPKITVKRRRIFTRD